MENRLYNIAKECDKFEVLTKNVNVEVSMNYSQKAKLEEFIENAKLLISAMGYNKVDIDFKLLEDIMFTSPSEVAQVVMGHHCSGPTTWKTIDGKTLSEIL